MEVTRRTLLLSAGAAGLLATLAACAPAATPRGTVITWSSFPSRAQEEYFRTNILNAFPGPGTVQMVVKPNAQILQQTQTALASGNGPDVFGTAGPSTGVAEFVAAGYLLDLDPYIATHGWDEKFAAWALDASRVDGTLRTLPTSYESLVYFYNPDTLDQLGFNAAPTSLEEFEALNTEADGQGIIPIAAGNSDYKGANEWYVAFALNHAAGPDALYAALTGELAWTDPAFVDAITLLKDWFQRGWFGGGVESYFTTTFPSMYSQLASGEAAGMVSGSWELTTLPEFIGEAAGNSARWEWANLPSLNADVSSEIFSLGIGASVGINAETRSPDEAAAWLDFSLTDLDTVVASIADISAQPAPIRLDAADFPSNTDERTVRFYSALSNTTNIGYTPWTFFPQQTETYLINSFEQVITDSLSVEDYCAGIQERFTPEFESGRVPTAPVPNVSLQP